MNVFCLDVIASIQYVYCIVFSIVITGWKKKSKGYCLLDKRLRHNQDLWFKKTIFVFCHELKRILNDLIVMVLSSVSESSVFSGLSSARLGSINFVELSSLNLYEIFRKKNSLTFFYQNLKFCQNNIK